MKVLVACEFSGTVGEAFQAKGHHVLTCDLLPTESRKVPHYQGDVGSLIDLDWDLIVAHPPCTRLTNAGVRWLHERNLWNELDAACDFFRQFMHTRCPRVAIENPIPHKYALERIGRKYDQLVQPWMFGHGESKAVCLWLKGLRKLEPTEIVDGREARVHRMPPGPDRAKERSRFFPGIAKAMAEQWG